MSTSFISPWYIRGKPVKVILNAELGRAQYSTQAQVTMSEHEAELHKRRLENDDEKRRLMRLNR